MGKDKDFSVFISPDMYCIVFSCVVYYRLKAFRKNRENKTHGKIAILQYIKLER